MRVAELEKQVFHTKNVLSFEEASRFLNLSKSYLYKLTSGNLIPHYKPQGRCSISSVRNWKRGCVAIPSRRRRRSKPRHNNMFSDILRRRSSDERATKFRFGSGGFVLFMAICPSVGN